MARRRAKKRRSRRKTFSILNAVESYAYASILTEGLFDATPMQFLTSPDNVTDAARSLTPDATQAYFLQNPQLGATYGANPLSLRDIIGNPGFAANAIIGRSRANVIPMVFSAATVNIGMRLFKRALRRPLANVNRNLVKPMLGAGIRL
jgi:hypothetical protein